MENFFGSAIKKLRESKGIKLEQLAEKSNFSSSYLSKIERGDTGISVQTLERILNPLNYTLSELLIP